MPTTTLRGVVDTYSTQAIPKQTNSGNRTLYLRGASGKAVHAYLLFSGIPAGATVVSAKVQLTLASAWSGSTTVTTNRVTSSWSPSKLSWSKGATVATTGQITQAVSGVAALGRVEVDVTALAQSWANGTPNYGIRIATTGNSLQRIYSSEAKVAADRKPVLIIEYVMAPPAPTSLVPAGGQKVSVFRPTHTWLYADALSSSMSAYQFQTSTSSSFSSPSYDSEAVNSSTPQHVLTFDAPASYWWRVRVKNSTTWSDWSLPQEAGYFDKPALTITDPTSGGTVSDSTPSISWATMNQTAWQVLLARGSELLYDTGFQSGDDTNWTATFPLGYADGPVTAEVRTWDNVDRATTPGDPAYASRSVTFTYAGSVGVPGASSLVATPDSVRPVVNLTWNRTSTPDAWTVLRDGEPVLRIMGAELSTGGTSYAWTDLTADPHIEHTWKVVANENGVDAATQPTSTATIRQTYLWLLDETDPTWWIALADKDELGMSLAESSEVLYVKGGDRGVLVHDSLRGYEGTVSGSIYEALPGMDGFSAQSLRNRLWHVKRNPTRIYRLVAADMNIPVVVRNLNVAPRPDSELSYGVSFEVYQQGVSW